MSLSDLLALLGVGSLTVQPGRYFEVLGEFSQLAAAWFVLSGSGDIE